MSKLWTNGKGKYLPGIDVSTVSDSSGPEERGHADGGPWGLTRSIDSVPGCPYHHRKPRVGGPLGFPQPKVGISMNSPVCGIVAASHDAPRVDGWQE